MNTITAPTRLRPLAEEDIPQVAELHRTVLRRSERSSPELLREYQVWFRDAFFESPFREREFEPLVYCDGTRVIGFLGLSPRPMTLNGAPILAVVCSQFVVDPKAGTPAAIELVRAALNGPQDLLIADESNAKSRKLWEAMGGSTALLYSTRWLYPLRPCQFACWAAGKQNPAAATIGKLGRPAARMLDWVASRSGLNPYSAGAPETLAASLDLKELQSCLSGLARVRPLAFAYESRQLEWLIRRSAGMRRHGELQQVLVRTAAGEIAGWYVYYLNQAGPSEVLQMYAVKHFGPEVFENLVHHASSRGAMSLSGRAEPWMAEALFRRRCPLIYGPEWFLAHSRNPAIQRAIDRGEAGLSRLDGEWALHFR